MIIKVDKSDDFIQKNKKLISEYDGHIYNDDQEDEKYQILNEDNKK
tara:strand:+ start:123 stop:260 length:138 start_codon:yes stop_codon:yes gene_type:complete